MKNLLPTALVKHPLRGVLILFISVVTAIGCGYSLITDHSVRFSERTGRAFYRLPPLPLMYDKATERELSSDQYLNYDDDNWESYEARERRDQETVAQVDTIRSQASEAITTRNLALAKERLEEFLSKTELSLPESSDMETVRQKQRNTAVDMLDVIASVRLGSKPESVLGYLRARQRFDDEIGMINLSDLRSRVIVDRDLDDNWVYLEGAVAYKSGDKEAAGERFDFLYTHYPKSEKREAALYMKARIALETSYSFDARECGFTGGKLDPYYFLTDDAEAETGVSTQSGEVDEKCRDDKWGMALNTFKLLVADYPKGRYVDDSKGWIAFIHMVGGQQAEALAEYYSLLGHPTIWKVRLQAKKSLQVLGHHFDDKTLDRVEALLADDANGAMAYAYHRIYNEAVDYTYQEDPRWYYPTEDWSEKQKEKDRVEKLRETGKHELERVTKFATKMMQRYPHSSVSAGFVTRVAEAQLELQNFDDAVGLASRAIQIGVSGDVRAQALWVKGSGEHQTRNFLAAEKTFEQLLAEFPDSKYAEGSRRLLAISAEDRGDLEAALGHYLALKYEYDIAYFVDVLLPTDRLAAYVAERKKDPNYNRLLYSLAVRYMRDRRWIDARATLRQVETMPDRADGWYPSEEQPQRPFAKNPDYERKIIEGISAASVLQDLKTVDTMENLEQAVDTAQGDEAKAEAMYQLASRQFDSSSLLFYNATAWNGARYNLLSELALSGRMRSPTETQIVFDHFQSHDTLARAIPIYVEIVNRYPQTRVAKDAMYSAAVAHERLSDLNPYWRDIYAKRLYAGPRLVTYNDVRAAYPRYQLPRSTYGWQPSTRTVNGGPGWAAPEKPAPRLSRSQKVKREMRWAAEKMKSGLRWLGHDVVQKVEGKVDTFLYWYNRVIALLFSLAIASLVAWRMIVTGKALKLLRMTVRLLTRIRNYPPRIVIVGLPELPPTESRIDKVIDAG